MPSVRDGANPVSLFYSYSHQDEELRDKLKQHLAALRRSGLISEWHDREIEAGDDWKGKIDSHLGTADIVLLLVSAAFIDSDYCWGVEMTKALERHDRGEVKVIPVILSHCLWKTTPLSALQVVPRDGKPVTAWPDREEAFYNVGQAILGVANELRQQWEEEAKQSIESEVGRREATPEANRRSEEGTDKRSSETARTHAILVGIEKYNAGSAWDMDGPAKDAIEFRHWLLDRGVPKKHVRTLLSPLDKNTALIAEANAEPATNTNILEALNRLHEQEGDLLFLFWAGHGVVSAERERRLFCADATSDDKRNVNLDSLLKSLGSNYFAGFPRQILIVDASANYEEELSWAFKIPSATLPVGDPLAGHEQFLFFAAKPGQVANITAIERRGLFSQEVLGQLALTPASTWPPDMQIVAERVQDNFAAKRAAGNTTQDPIYLWTSDQRSLPRNKALMLTEGLLECATMMDPGRRDDVVRVLRPDIRNIVHRSDQARSDVLNIVLAAANYFGGLEELLEVVSYFEGDSAPMQRLKKFAK